MIIVGSGDISNTLAAYQLLLGGENNGGEPGSKPSGFRSINWDGVPDELAAPNDYPSDFFNAPNAPRARGAILTQSKATIDFGAVRVTTEASSTFTVANMIGQPAVTPIMITVIRNPQPRPSRPARR